MTKIKSLLAAASAAFFIASSALAQTGGEVGNHAVPIGKGPGVVGFTSVAPGQPRTVLMSNGASSDPAFNFFTVDTIAALKALPAPSVATTVYVVGYASAGDGGEGWFNYNTASSASDNGGTVIIPNSAPGTGRWLRQRVGDNGNRINVKWFGAKGDGTTADGTAVTNAMTVAIAIHGALYFPATSACYATTIVVPDGTVGLRIMGDAKGTGGATGNVGSVLCGSVAGHMIDASSPGGSMGNITIEHLKVYNNGSGDAIRFTNNVWITLQDLVLFSASGTALNFVGVGNFNVFDVEAYGGSGAALKIGASGITNSGPGTITGGEFSNQGGSATNCIAISGQTLSIVFNGAMFACQGPNMVASVTIDGDGVSATQAGMVTFVSCHSESSYNTANTGADFLIGATNKFGTVSIISWSGFGQGNGTNTLRDSVRIVAAQNVSIRDTKFGLLATGYTRSAIRLETTFPTANDRYDFRNNFVTSAAGVLYSDANGRLATTFFGDAAFDVSAFNNLLGTVSANNACAGCIGEYLSATLASGSAVTLTNNTAATITSITLTPGDWDVKGSCGYASTSASTSITRSLCSLSLVNNGLDVTPGRFYDLAFPAFSPPAGAGHTIQVAPERFSVASSTPVYLIAFSAFTVAGNTAYGKISARRMR
jgi:hypothetical protein